MISKKQFFENFNLYAVTHFESVSPDIIHQVDRAYRGGAGIVQLRMKQVSDRDFIRLGLKVREIARHYGRGFVVNNRVDLALAVNADAVHVGQEDMPLEHLRSLLEKLDSPLLIGKSTHSLEQALAAQEEGADYIGVGPVFSTPTKPDYAPVGLELVSRVKQKIRIPFVAIGGIDESNASKVLKAGASCIAVVRAIFSSPDPMQSAAALRSILDKEILK